MYLHNWFWRYVKNDLQSCVCCFARVVDVVAMCIHEPYAVCHWTVTCQLSEVATDHHRVWSVDSVEHCLSFAKWLSLLNAGGLMWAEIDSQWKNAECNVPMMTSMVESSWTMWQMCPAHKSVRWWNHHLPPELELQVSWGGCCYFPIPLDGCREAVLAAWGRWA